MKLILYTFIFLFTSILFAQSPEVIANMESKSFMQNNHTIEQRMQNPELVDVTSYDLSFDFNQFLTEFTGKSVITFIVLEETNQVNLDADNNLNISTIYQDADLVANFSRSNNNVTVELDEMKSPGEIVQITVNYTCSVQSSQGLTKDYHNGVPVITSLSEPFYASSWWVGIDNLQDKADVVDIRIKHPAGFKVGSNGILISEENIDNNRKETHWKTAYPIPAYLVSIAMTNYVEYNNSANIGGTTLPIINYVYPESLDAETQSLLDAVPSYVEFFSDLVGEYPYNNEKYGHSQWNNGGGMEHATMSSQGHFGTSLTAHELAHQWFGDKVTCGTWSDIWLNEGFASYMEGMLRHEIYGDDFFKEWKENRIAYIMSQPDGSVYIPESQASSSNRIFDYRLTYIKGAMVAHMLRFTLGDEAYFQALKNYLNDPEIAYGFATTPDLISHLESQSGRDLTEFFADWVYGEGFPILNADMQYNQNNNTAVLTIEQENSTFSSNLFETDLEIGLKSNNGEVVYRRLSLEENNQTFYLEDLPANFISYELNPNFDIIAMVSTTTLNTQDISNQSDISLKIYPNPVATQLYIMAPKRFYNVRIYDTSGKLLIEKTINDSEADIYVQALPSGTYVLEVVYDDGKEVKNFIKK